MTWTRKLPSWLEAHINRYWKRIGTLQNEILLVWQDLDAYRLGIPKPRQNETYSHLKQQLHDILSHHDEMPIIKHIRSLTRNIRLRDPLSQRCFRIALMSK
jgi:hypothetical protein